MRARFTPQDVLALAEDPVIQAIGRLEFEDGLSIGALNAQG